MQAASQATQPSTPSSRGHWPALVSPLPWSLTNDERRPDGLTLGPWYRGLSLVWDATVMDTFAQGHYKHCQTGRFCNHKSWGRKMPKISWPPKPLSLTTSGNWDHWCVWQVHCPFLSGLAKKLVDVSGDPREYQWLHQRLSLAVFKGNAASILACVWVWSNFTCSFSSSCFYCSDHHHCLPLAPVSMCSYCLPNPRSFCKINFPSVVQCYLVH